MKTKLVITLLCCLMAVSILAAPQTGLQIMQQEGLSPYSWKNSPGDLYAPHSHSYHKVIYVVTGSITFNLPELDRQFRLTTGDRLDLPRGVLHAAVVGPEGVHCLEAHRDK